MSVLSRCISRLRPMRPRRERGISLIEVALGMVILGIIMSGMLMAYRMYQHNRAINITREHLEMVEDALGTFVASQGRYPAPQGFRLREGDAGYGREGTTTGNCAGTTPPDSRVCITAGVGGNVLIGSLPFQEINMPASATLDGWGRRFTYAVSQAMTAPGGNDPLLQSICVRQQDVDASGDEVLIDCTSANNNPPQDIIVISHGRDGLGGWTSEGRVYRACPGSSGGRQYQNCNYTSYFVKPNVAFLRQDATFNDDIVSVDLREDSNYWMQLAAAIRNRDDLRVGIGTQNPVQTLDIEGSAKSEKLRADALCSDDDGNPIDCFDPDKIAGSGMSCGEAAYMVGIANNDARCEPIIPWYNCPDPFITIGIGSDGVPICQDPDNPSACAPVTAYRNVDCPAGQTGTIVQRREYSCATFSWEDWEEDSSTCMVPTPTCATVPPSALYGTCTPQGAGWRCCKIDGCQTVACQVAY